MLREHHTGGNWLQFYNPNSSDIVIRLYYGSDPGDSGDYVIGTKISYSDDRGSSWKEYLSSTDLRLSQYYTVMFRCETGAENWELCEAAQEKKPLGRFYTSSSCECSGDAMTLLDNTLSKTSIPDRAFEGLFKYTSITTSPEISATEIGEYSCKEMFCQCENLTSGPSVLLPAALANGCYMRMFYGDLVMPSTPELKFTVTAPNSCESMFCGCSNIEEISLLPTDLTAECFKEMLKGCSKLNRIETRFSIWPEYRNDYYDHDTDDIRKNATQNWTRDVAETGTFVRTVMLPLYINDKSSSGHDMYSGEIYNRDPVHNVDYDTTDMFNFDPWVGEGCYNLTEVPASVVKYRTVAKKNDPMTVRFDILTSKALTRDNGSTIEDAELSQFAEERFGTTGSHLSPGHAGKLDITALFREIIEHNGGDANDFLGEHDYLTPDHDVTIDWGDGTQRTVIPKLCYVDSSYEFEDKPSDKAKWEDGDTIGGIIKHIYTSGEGSFIISVWGGIDASDSFLEIAPDADNPTNPYGSAYSSDIRFKGVMVPLHAGVSSNIEALLTPLLPIYAGRITAKTDAAYSLSDTESQYPPLAGMFYGNTDLVSVPDGFDEELTLDNLSSTVLSSAFCKNRENLNHPFGAAYMFYGCENLKNAPSLETMNLKGGLSQGQWNGEVKAIDGVKKNNSALECFMKNCFSLSRVRIRIDSQNLAPFELASAFDMTDLPQGSESSLKKIDFRNSHFEKWPVYPSSTQNDDCWGTLNWTRNVRGEYTKNGTLSSLSSEITSVKSLSTNPAASGKHEYNPWSENGPDDDEYLTFTNNTQTTHTITLKNQRKMFASLVNGSRHLDFKADRTTALERECHIHLLRYRVKSASADWTNQTPWLDITDDTLNDMTIHGSDYASSTLTSSAGYDFVWSFDLAPGQMIQIVGIPASMMRVYPEQVTIGVSTETYPMIIGLGDMHKKSWRFIDTYYDSDSAYWYDVPHGAAAGGGDKYLTVGRNDLGNLIKVDLYEEAYHYGNGNPHQTVPYKAYNANGYRMSGIPDCFLEGSSLKFAKTTRMFTQISNKDFWYQFYGCEDLDVTGFIDTFFDCLDYKSPMYCPPPYTFYRLFSGTGIKTAPKIFATVGPNRGEFAECFKNCTGLLSPAKMNLSEQEAVPRQGMGPAKTLRFNYIAGPTVPFGAVETNSASNSGPYTDNMLHTSYIHPTGYCDTECLWSDNHSGAFEESYKGCTSLVWPTHPSGNGLNYPEQMCIAFHRGNGHSYNSRSNAFESAFEGCTSIGTFGLVSYSKDGLMFDPKENSSFQHQPFKNMFKDCTVNDTYLWDCFYTNASLKKYSWWGGNDGVKDCWQGGRPTRHWLGGTTNIAKLQTNCCKPPQSGHYVSPINVWTDASRGGTCSSVAWGNAYTDHHSTDPYMGSELPNGGQNYNKVWVRWNRGLNTNPWLLTWRTEDDGSQTTLDNIQ